MISNPHLWKASLRKIATHLQEVREGKHPYSAGAQARMEQDLFIGFHIIDKLIRAGATLSDGAPITRLGCTVLTVVATQGKEVESLLTGNFLLRFDLSGPMARQERMTIEFLCGALADSFFLWPDYGLKPDIHRFDGMYFNTRTHRNWMICYISSKSLVDFLTLVSAPDPDGGTA